MKILAIADRWPQNSIKEVISNNPSIELIVTLWDLELNEIIELEAINLPKIGVYWNHCSGQYFDQLWIRNMHLQTFNYWWISFWWFEWCVRYKPRWSFQYTQEEANEMIKSLPYVDVVLCHCPPKWINDDPNDNTHIWFDATRKYIENYSPKYLFHGHTYDNYNNFIKKYKDTNIEYVYWTKILEIN